MGGWFSTLSQQAKDTFSIKALITSAQLKALPGTTPLIVPARGIGTIIAVQQSVLRYIFGTTAYTIGNVDNFLAIEYASGVAIQPTILATNFLDQVANAINLETWSEVDNVAAAPVLESRVANNDIILTLGGTAPALTLGDGELEIELLCRLIKL